MNQSDERKDNIQRVIETALDMFMENGIAATSMSATSIRLINFLLNVFIMYPPKKEIFLCRFPPAVGKSPPLVDGTGCFRL